jgi:hypothetical protein
MKDVNSVNDIAKILQLLPKYTQALNNDSVLYFSDEEAMASPERKVLVVKDIMMIEELLTYLKKSLA